MRVPTGLKIIIFILCGGISTMTLAEIYSWKDAQGKVHFGDRQPNDHKSEQVKVRVNTYNAPPVVTTVKSIPISKGKVVLYTTQRCGYCKMAKQFLKKNKIKYSEYDVEKSKKGKRDFKKLKGKGVPIILVGDQRMSGFSEDRMVSMLKKSGYEL
jgi:glutaredoxin